MILMMIMTMNSLTLMIMIAIVFLIIMIITYWSWCSLWKLSLNYWGVQRKVKVKISLILPIIFTRYDVTGFVEELPQLPENRRSHACSALPATGVRPAQSSLCSWWLPEDMHQAWLLLCWHSSLEQKNGLPWSPSRMHFIVLKLRLWEAGSGWLGVGV